MPRFANRSELDSDEQITNIYLAVSFEGNWRV
jgi:hypothetical protein